ncbi:leucine-rich repeat domain-containing protein [Blautia schinkii]|nr:leucine-rich repeat domain-containing protein [Blautia schinkii]
MKLKLLTTVLFLTLVFGASTSAFAADTDIFSNMDTIITDTDQDQFSVGELDTDVFNDGENESAEIFSSEESGLADTVAGDFVVDGIIYQNEESGKTCSIVGYTDDIPQTLEINGRADGKRITRIADGAFKNCERLVSLTIEAAIPQIGTNVFEGCFNLTISCYKNTPIYQAALNENIKVNAMDFLPQTTIDGVIYTRRDDSSYSAWAGGVNVVLKDSIYGIPVDHLEDVEDSLETIQIPDSITSLGSVQEGFLFRGSNIKELIIPDSVKGIASDYIAEGCPNLKTVDTGNGINAVGAMYFANCGSLETVRIGTAVTQIGAGAFMSCPNLKEVYIPANVKSISQSAFDESSEQLVIVGDTGSYAECYARGMGIAFQSTGNSISESRVFIEDARVTGNSVYVTAENSNLSVEGYDYLMKYSSNNYFEDEWITVPFSVDFRVQKNAKPGQQVCFPYVGLGTYYIYSHGWIRDEKGNKQFTDWSNPAKVVVTVNTPDQPKIKRVKVKGKTVTVEITGGDALGYDCVLGTGQKKSLSYYQCNELRKDPVYQIKPATYKYIAKNKKSTTIVFKNVKPGKYNVALHSFTRQDGKKVFSKWSEMKKIKV